jgi:hypothetical protein
MIKNPNAILMICLLSLTLIAGGCASTQTNIKVNENGTYSAMASSYTTEKAYKAALSAASNYCRKMGKRIVNVNDSKTNTITSDDVVDDNRVPAGGGAASFEKDKHPGTSKTTDDSKVTLDFRCI